MAQLCNGKKDLGFRLLELALLVLSWEDDVSIMDVWVTLNERRVTIRLKPGHRESNHASLSKLQSGGDTIERTVGKKKSSTNGVRTTRRNGESKKIGGSI